MKTLCFIFGLGIILTPSFVLAQGMINFSDAKTPSGMMQYIEDKSLGADLHEEAEGLMEKMMTGKLTETEASRLVEIMNQYPAPMGMMLNRLNGKDDYQKFSGQNNWGMPHMGNYNGGYSDFWSWTAGLMHLVWLLISILALVWLWQRVAKK